MTDFTKPDASSSRDRIIHGVDFSGADAGGEAGIRLASRSSATESLIDRIERLDRTSLRRRIMASLEDGNDHLWLIDAPFGIPCPTLEACGIPLEWTKTVEWMAGFQTPRDWRRGVRTVTRKEPRRVADRAASTPLASMNLRIFKQTWTAMVELLQPLAMAGVRIEPLAGPKNSRVVVAEGCPASILKRGGDSSRGYKGKSDSNRDRRREILEIAHRRWGLRISEAVADRCIDGTAGDDLDAVLLTLDPLVTVYPPEALVEGWVFS